MIFFTMTCSALIQVSRAISTSEQQLCYDVFCFFFFLFDFIMHNHISVLFVQQPT